MLANLACDNVVSKEAITVAGGIPALVQCLCSNNEVVRTGSAMSSGSPVSCAIIAEEGGIPLLVERLSSRSN